MGLKPKKLQKVVNRLGYSLSLDGSARYTLTLATPKGDQTIEVPAEFVFWALELHRAAGT